MKDRMVTSPSKLYPRATLCDLAKHLYRQLQLHQRAAPEQSLRVELLSCGAEQCQNTPLVLGNYYHIWFLCYGFLHSKHLVVYLPMFFHSSVFSFHSYLVPLFVSVPVFFVPPFQTHSEELCPITIRGAGRTLEQKRWRTYVERRLPWHNFTYICGPY